REVATTDPAFYRWTQWIFLRIFGSWVDEQTGRARPIGELIAEFESGARPVPGPPGTWAPWPSLTPEERRRLVDGYRLAYLSDELVNWCPGLGTVLANEEVTADGRSDIGNYPVYRRPLRQWMLRITAFAERLLADLDALDWPEPIKLRQRNWIGASDGALIAFPVDGPMAGADASIEVFTTRPDTLTGATYLVLAPEHPLAGELVASADAAVRDAVGAYREQASRRSDRQRAAEGGAKTGVPTGRSVINVATGEPIPVYLADYVLAGYGTGAIMAVPAHDERDRDFADAMGLPVREVDPAWLGDLAGAITWLRDSGHGRGARAYRLRDWQFSRQRYWGEPFPIVYDEHGPVALPEAQLPVRLPDMNDFRPAPGEQDSEPVPPLARATEWAEVTLDLGDGPRPYRRELNTMPQWAGSCWYYLRYLDPANDQVFIDPEIDRYWMTPAQPRFDGDGGVGLYVGGVEHGVLHLLYARFWHKVLYDLGQVATREPFQRLVNQGYILADSFTDERGMYVAAAEVEHEADGYTFQGRPVTQRSGKMGKSLKNSVSPDDIYDAYGADTLRLYEMATGPLDTSRPWQTGDIIGVHRLLQRLWRTIIDEATGEARVSGSSRDGELDPETARRLHRTIAVVRADLEALHYNTAIARLTELVSHAARLAAEGGGSGGGSGAALPRALAEPLVLMMAPLAPHIAEELWSRLGHAGTLAYEPFPVADPALAVEDTVELPVQINGKVRFTVGVPAEAGEDAVRELVTGNEASGGPWTGWPSSGSSWCQAASSTWWPAESGQPNGPSGVLCMGAKRGEHHEEDDHVQTTESSGHHAADGGAGQRRAGGRAGRGTGVGIGTGWGAPLGARADAGSGHGHAGRRGVVRGRPGLHGGKRVGLRRQRAGLRAGRDRAGRAPDRRAGGHVRVRRQWPAGRVRARHRQRAVVGPPDGAGHLVGLAVARRPADLQAGRRDL
ncbi:MAG TPA: class I tRNA ligase family protein, partial [Streptosporangiaceae bacterium]